MQKQIVLLALIAVFASGCSAPSPSPDPPPPETTATSLFENAEVPVTESAPTEAGSGQITSEAECRNPFYPVHHGAWLMYTLSDGNRPSHTMSVSGDNAFTITVQSDSSTFALEGQCTEEGIILLDVSGVPATYLGGSGNSALTIQNMEGVTLPNDVQVGDAWSQIISILGADLTATIETTYTAMGFESVTIPAGTFNALKVEQNGALNMGGQLSNTHAFLWYAQDIGIVKSAMDGIPSSELLAYNFP